MMLGFKRRFAPFVKDGSKRHTIRSRRKIRPKAGEVCHCYVDPRQKTMALLGRWPCVKVEDIQIYTRGDGTFGVVVGKEELDREEKNALAWADGFRSDRRAPFLEMMRFWVTVHGDGSEVIELPDHQPKIVGFSAGVQFSGDLIHWDFDHPVGAGGTSPDPTPERAPSPDCSTKKKRRSRART